MTTINLQKGQRIDLTKDNPTLTKVIVGLGWDENEFDSPFEFDLDASAFLLNAQGKCRKDADFVFYNNLSVPGVEHTGDNRVGDAEGDDEQVIVDFDAVPYDVQRIAFTVTIHEAEERRQSFGQVRNAYVRLVDETTGNEILRYQLDEDFSIETSLVFCELYRQNNEWKFNAVGAGYQGGLAALVRAYGLSV